MKNVSINDKCNQCGICVVKCPQLFAEDESGNIRTLSSVADETDELLSAAKLCPVKAIELSDGGNKKESIESYIQKLEKCKEGISITPKDVEFGKVYTSFVHAPYVLSSKYEYKSSSKAERAGYDAFMSISYSQLDNLILDKITAYRVTKVKPYFSKDTESVYTINNKIIEDILKAISVIIGTNNLPSDFCKVDIYPDEKSLSWKMLNKGELLGANSIWIVKEQFNRWKSDYRLYINYNDMENYKGKTLYNYSAYEAVSEFEDNLKEALSYAQDDIESTAITEVKDLIECYNKRLCECLEKNLKYLKAYVYRKVKRRCIMSDEVILKKNHSELGITQEYTGNRQLWDSTKSKQNYKDEVFGDKKTIRDKGGTVLHKNHNAAKNKYHHKDKDGNIVSSSYAKHAAETDHIVPLEKLHKHAKKNPFLSDNDLKEIANAHDNYQILSKSDNASKGADRSLDLKSHAHLQKEFTKKTITNAGAEFIEGAANTLGIAAMNAILDGVKRVFIDGEKVDEALKEEAKAVGCATVVGGTEKLLIDATTHYFANSSNKVLNAIIEKNAVGQILVLGVSVGMSTMKYLNDEITASELTEEIIRNGAIIIASTLVTSVIPIPFLGAVVSSIAVNVANAINQINKQMDSYLIKERAIHKLSAEAVAEMERQRNEFNANVKENLAKWDKQVGSAFETIIVNADYNNFNPSLIVEGLDEILSLCGSTAKFHSVEEWESQLDKPLELKF